MPGISKICGHVQRSDSAGNSDLVVGKAVDISIFLLRNPSLFNISPVKTHVILARLSEKAVAQKKRPGNLKQSSVTGVLWPSRACGDTENDPPIARMKPRRPHFTQRSRFVGWWCKKKCRGRRSARPRVMYVFKTFSAQDLCKTLSTDFLGGRRCTIVCSPRPRCDSNSTISALPSLLAGSSSAQRGVVSVVPG